MTETRAEDKAENEATIKDAKEAQTAVAEAIAVLEEFYKSTGAVEKEAWELMQTARRVKEVQPEKEEYEPEPYQATEGGTGVIGMLEEIATDFAKMETEARADETT